MAINFLKTPQNRFYSYLPDGHIYNIAQEQPTVIAADGGGILTVFLG